MDSIFILMFGPNGNGAGIISLHYDEDDANEALRDVQIEPEYSDAYIEQWEVA